jgi:hypothetical protein
MPLIDAAFSPNQVSLKLRWRFTISPTGGKRERGLYMGDASPTVRNPALFEIC